MLEESEKSASASGIIGPLSFSNQKTEPKTPVSLFESPLTVQCLFCDKTYQFYAEKDDYLAHLYLDHRLVIGDEEQVAIFHEYLIYWRKIFDGDERKMANHCTTMLLDQMPDGTPAKGEKYYLLCDILPQDNELRQNLQKKRLEHALEQHQFERTDTNFKRTCLFCRDSIEKTRNDFLEHLFSKHFLQIGKPENLVFIDELIDMIQGKMTNFICLFCEKKFPNRETLKEHMRKKGHKRINPTNKNYDRFFLINYQTESYIDRKKRTEHHQKTRKQSEKDAEVATADGQKEQKLPFNKGKSKQKNKNDSSVFESDSDSDWSGWEGDKQDMICLFCPQNELDTNKLKMHMLNKHKFDFDKVTESLTFYDRVKIVNFIRRKVYLLHCIWCDEEFQSTDLLQLHLTERNHYCLDDRKKWDLPEYFFPTYEDDGFLCSLDDTELDDETCVGAVESGDSTIIVHSEDTKVSINLDAEALSKECLKEI